MELVVQTWSPASKCCWNNVLKMLKQDAPSDQAQLASFKQKEVKATILIVLSLVDNELEIVKSKKTAKEMGTELKELQIKRICRENLEQ